MNIALMSHTKKQDLMVQFCTAYCGVLSKHTVCATNATGRMVAEATGLPVNLFLSHEHGGIEQIGQRIIYNEIDLVLFFNSPQDHEMDKDILYITRLCDQHSVPVATNSPCNRPSYLTIFPFYDSMGTVRRCCGGTGEGRGPSAARTGAEHPAPRPNLGDHTKRIALSSPSGG